MVSLKRHFKALSNEFNNFLENVATPSIPTTNFGNNFSGSSSHKMHSKLTENYVMMQHSSLYILLKKITHTFKRPTF